MSPDLMKVSIGQVGHNERMNARWLAVSGVVASALLMVFLIRSAMREIIGWQGRPWLGVLILAAPMVAVLAATGYRWYGIRRAVVVAVVVVAASGVVSGFATLKAIGAAQMPSGSTALVLALMFLTPLVSVLAIGLLALGIAAPGSHSEPLSDIAAAAPSED